MPATDGNIYIGTRMETNGLNKDIAAIERRLKDLKSAQVKVPAEDIAAIYQQKISEAEKKGERLQELLNKAVEHKQSFVDLGGDPSSFPSLDQDIEKQMQAIDQNNDRIAQLKERMQAVLPSEAPETIRQEGQAAKEAAPAVERLAKATEDFAKEKGKKAAAASSPVEKLSKATTDYARETGKAAKNTKLFSGNAKLANLSAGKLFKTVLKYVFGIRSLFMLVRKIRQAIKEGFKNFAQVDEQTNKSISSLRSSLSQLKNSFAVAFAPILNTVAPILNKLIQMIVTAMNYISMFFAALSGASTYNAAKYNYEDYADSLDKVGAAAQRNLSGLDEMNIWQTGGGGGGSGVDASDMFEKLPVEFAEGSFFDRFISAIKDGDWAEVGRIMGQKFNQTIDDIEWYDLGAKLGKKLTNIITVAYNFLSTADFAKLGKGIADAVNGFLVNTDWEMAARTVGIAITDILDAAIGFIENFDFKSAGKAISNFVSGFIDQIAEWFKKTSWDKVSTALTDGVVNLLNNIDGKKVGNAIKRLVMWVLNAVSEIVLNANVGDVTHAITTLVSDIIGELNVWEISAMVLKLLVSIAQGVIADLAKVIPELSVVNVLTKSLSTLLKSIGFKAGGAFFDGISEKLTGLGDKLGEFLRTGFKIGWEIIKRWITGDDGIDETDAPAIDDELAPEETELTYDVAISLHGRLESITLDNEDESAVYLAQKLIDDIYALNAVSIKTPEQIDEIITKCQMLNELGLDGITIEYDELTGEIKTQRSELEKLIKEYKKQLEVEALSEAYKEAYKTKVEAERKLEQLTGKHTDSVIKLHKAEQAAADYEAKYAGTSEYSATKMQELTDAVTAAQAEVDQYNSEIAQTRDVLADASDAVDFYYGKITESSKTGGKEIGKSITDGIDEGLGDGKTGIPKKTKDIVEGAITEADKATAGAYSVGEHLGQGLIDGIKSKAYLVRDAAAYAMTHGLTGFTVTAEIASPSKVTKRFGQYLDEGAALGIEGNAGMIEKAMSGSANTALYAMEAAFSGAHIPFPALASGSVIPPRAALAAASEQSAFGSAGLEQTLRSVLAEFMKSKTYVVEAKANQKTIFEIIIDEAKRQQAVNGRNPFMLSTLG